MIEVNRNGEVWVFAEQENGALADVSLELLGKGRELADRLGAKLGAVLLGSGVQPLAQRLAAFGADVVHLADSPALARYQTVSYAQTVCALIEARRPQICLFGATPIGRDLAPFIASRMRCGLTADCTDLQIGEYADAKTGEAFSNLLLQIRPAFGGNIIATIVNPRNWPQMATVREGVMKMPAEDVARRAEIVPFAPAIDAAALPVEVVESVRRARKVNLKAARIIVAGGAGVGSRENFGLLQKLAEALGGAVGASRAAVDLGFADAELQIGQTGVTVRPALYIACGISGAVQHRAGMQESAKIIAINTDREAPIFGIAHYGIVGDLAEVIPQFIKALK